MLIADTLQSLRRRIGDINSSAYVYDDPTLQGFIADAINELSIGGITLVYVNSIVQDYASDISPELSTIVTIKSQILVIYGEKASSDRDNLSLKKGKMTIDNRGQSKDHAQTLQLLETELQLRFNRYLADTLTGVRLV
jgi:vacuolar-type H+-ATPase subunit E/Vma4